MGPRSLMTSDIPVMWDWGWANGKDEYASHHKPRGANVLFLDGHAERVEYPGRFPVSDGFLEVVGWLEPDLFPMRESGAAVQEN